MSNLARKIAAGGSGIQIKPSHKGLLHKALGVPSSQQIPLAKIQKAAGSSNPVLAKRGQFALNARKFNH